MKGMDNFMDIKSLMTISFVLTATLSNAFGATVEDQAKRLTNIVSALNVETLNNSPGASDEFQITINLNLAVIPDFDKTVGTKDEGEESAPAIPKPSVRFDYKRVFVEFGGTPEIEAYSAKSRNFSAKLGYGTELGPGDLSIWGSYNEGRIVADITNPDIKSQDELSYKSKTVSVSYGYRLENFTPFVSLGYGDFASSLFVVTDDDTTESSHTGAIYGIGSTYIISESISVLAEINVVEGILTHPRFGISYKF